MRPGRCVALGASRRLASAHLVPQRPAVPSGRRGAFGAGGQTTNLKDDGRGAAAVLTSAVWNSSATVATSDCGGSGGSGGSGSSDQEQCEDLDGLLVPLVTDTTPDTWRTPLRRPGSVVALGKFDALHRGHQALADAAAELCSLIEQEGGARKATWTAMGPVDDSSIAANGDGSSRAGTGVSTSGQGGDSSGSGSSGGDAVLLSFSGMGAVLGWADKLPLTAPQDRGRVLAGWGAALRRRGAGQHCRMVRLRTMPFSLIRSMSPEQFVALLAEDLGAAGVVAGRNYRFGFKAAGDADTLVRLGAQYGMRVTIVDMVGAPDGGGRTTQGAGRGLGPGLTGTGMDAERQLQLQAAVAAADGLNSSSSGVGVFDVGARSAALVGPGSSFSGFASTDMDVEAEVSVLEGLAGTSTSSSSSNGGAGQGGAGGGTEGCSSTRVSSSRIRELLAAGRVEAVERLLGRKYRLVCDLTAATRAQSGRGTAEGATSAGSSSSSSGGRLLVPRACFQNQAPANGQYRVLVQLVATGPPGEEIAAEEDMAASSSGRRMEAGGASAVVGPACVVVDLTNAGMEVDLGQDGVGSLEKLCAPVRGSMILSDFDACG